MSHSISKPAKIDYFMMGLTALLWSSAFIAIKLVIPETGPLWLATWRVLIGFVVLLPYAIWRGFVWPATPRVWMLIFITALFNVVLPFFLISWAEQFINAGTTSLLMGAGPLLALLGSHLFTEDDKITPNRIMAVILGFAGVLTVVGVDTLDNPGGDTTRAQIATLCASLCYTIAGLMIRRIDIPPIRLACLTFGTGLFQLGLAAFLIAGPPNLNLGQTAFWALIYLGIFPTAVGQILRFTLIRKVGYAVFALALNLIPVFGVILGVLVLGEVITPRIFIALFLVLSGLYISQWNPRSKVRR